MAAKILGRHIVMDPTICHGEPTFQGTRILVADVLEQIANGMAWEAIIEEWRGSLTVEAISEAVRLSREALVTHSFIRRFLRHSTFNTQAKRMGHVVRVGHVGMQIWRLHADQEKHMQWSI